jgi:2-keto-3-deoxy-L-rhamnonate aldolase RhmA
VLHVGVNDLSVDLGHVGNPGHPEVIEACMWVIEAARSHGKLAAVGGLSDPLQVRELLRAGAAPLIFAAIDTDLLASALGQRTQDWRTRLGIEGNTGK